MYLYSLLLLGAIPAFKINRALLKSISVVGYDDLLLHYSHLFILFCFILSYFIVAGCFGEQ